jgi:hypothetical protein
MKCIQKNGNTKMPTPVGVSNRDHTKQVVADG